MSKLQVITYANGRYLALDGRVKSATVRGDIVKAYRTCEVEIVNAITLRKHILDFDNGKELRLIYDGKEIFRGVVMQHSIDTDGNTTIVAHDFGIYLVKNSDVVNYKKKTAAQILTDLCVKFNIPTGTITDTGYVIPKFIKSGSVYELTMAALYMTQEQTGKRYRLSVRNGTVWLTDVTVVTAQVVLENGRDIINAAKNVSIEDIFTKVKLTGGDEEKPITALATAPTAGQYGTMQHYEHVSDVKKASELQAKAKAMVEEKSRPKTEISISCLGNTDVISGSAVGVVESMTGLGGTFTVEADTHNFGADNSYMMSLTLSKVE